jgi:hypothetical protein
MEERTVAKKKFGEVDVWAQREKLRGQLAKLTN